MRKTTLLFIISILIGIYANPVIAQKAKKKYNQHNVQKSHWRESHVSSDYPDIPLTSPYHPSNSADEATNLNAIISDFQVNENTGLAGFYQGWCSISADGSGNFVITWVDQRNGYIDVYAQRYSSEGIALGSNFQVNDVQNSGSMWVLPSISVVYSGNFVITWTDIRNGNEDIYAQQYASDGTALGNNFKVSDDQGSARQLDSSISADSSGNFIITWVDERNGDQDIYAQRYSSDGTVLGNNFKVDDDQGDVENAYPSISSDDNGNFVVVWEDERNGEWYDDIYAQRYSSDGTALGSNFKVNDDQGSVGQFCPTISTDGSGNFIIVWEDDRNPIEGCSWYTDIYAQRYASDGTALDSNFQVNDDQVCAVQYYPSVAVDSSGNFIITWQDERNGWYYYDIYAQRYSSDGTPIESNFKVNDDQGIEWQTDPSVSVDNNGNFVIVWEDDRNGNYDIYAQLYSSAGTAVKSNFKVNDDLSGGTQWFPSISADGSGNFIITWEDNRNNNNDIYSQRYASKGTALGSNFQINDDQGILWQGRSSISADNSGNFIIAWQDERNGNMDIYAQRYTSDGIAQGSNFRVDDDIDNGNQNNPSISLDKKGNFVIVWWDERNGNSDIYAQRFSSDGTALGSNFKVNDDQVSAYQFLPSISRDGSGNFIIVWQDSRDDIYNDIYAQQYSSDGTALGSNFKVSDDQDSAGQFSPSISADNSGNYIIAWDDERNGNRDIYAQRYASDGKALGSNFQVNDDIGRSNQNNSSISADSSGNFIIVWEDERNSNFDIYAQQYSNDGKALGTNIRVTNTGAGLQRYPDVILWDKKIYNTWGDNRAGETGFDIWANVLDWDDPGGTSVDELSQIPTVFIFYQNYPNPFNPSTTIEFTLPKSEFVTLKVFNILGEEIATLVNNKLQAGNHTYRFDGSSIASGVYIYRIEAGKFLDVKKMVILH